MQFDEVMLALFEHVPGFETLPRKRSIQYREILRSRLPNRPAKRTPLRR